MPLLATQFDYMLMSASLHGINCVVGGMSSGINRLVGVGNVKADIFNTQQHNFQPKRPSHLAQFLRC